MVDGGDDVWLLRLTAWFDANFCFLLFWFQILEETFEYIKMSFPSFLARCESSTRCTADNFCVTFTPPTCCFSDPLGSMNNEMGENRTNGCWCGLKNIDRNSKSCSPEQWNSSESWSKYTSKRWMTPCVCLGLCAKANISTKTNKQKIKIIKLNWWKSVQK